MGDEVFSRTRYVEEVKKRVPRTGPVTKIAEQIAQTTKKLNPIVDPGVNQIRRSLRRFEKQDDGLLRLTVGTPLPSESRVDTTGSMGGNVDVAMRRLPDTYELCNSVLPDGYDLQLALGIFADECDNFILCRPQFEMLTDRIISQLLLMVPERNGGDTPEDPQYGLFGAAYLTDRDINKIGLKGYDFTITDAPGRKLLEEDQLVRVFGNDVFEKVAENGYQINRRSLPTTTQVVQDLLQSAHAFVLQVNNNSETTGFWSEIYGENRVIKLIDTEYLPQVQAAIIGLTEGTLGIQQITKFLVDHDVRKNHAETITLSLANIPIGAQAMLPNFERRPRKGALFRSKEDIWPIGDQLAIAGPKTSEADPADEVENDSSGEGPDWL